MMLYAETDTVPVSTDPEADSGAESVETETVKTSQYVIEPCTIEQMPVVAGFGLSRPAPLWVEKLTAQLTEIGAGTHTIAGGLHKLVTLLATFDQVCARGEPQAYLAAGTDEPDRAQRRDCLVQWLNLFYVQAGRILVHRFLPQLAQWGVHVPRMAQLGDSQLAWAHEQFLRRFYPILTPLAVDSGRPFPYISDRSVNLLVELQSPEQVARQRAEVLYARVKIPQTGWPLLAVPRYQDKPKARHRNRPHRRMGGGKSAADLYVWSGDLLSYFIHELFPGMTLRNFYWFRVLRAPRAATFDTAPVHDNGRHEVLARTGFETGSEQDALSSLHEPGHDVVEAEAAADFRMSRRLSSTHSQFTDAPRLRTGRLAERQDATPVIRLEIEARMPDAVVRWLARHLQVPLHGIMPTPYPLEMFSLPLLEEALPGLLEARGTSLEEPRAPAPVYAQIDRKTR